MTSQQQTREESTRQEPSRGPVPLTGHDPRAVLSSIGEATYDWDILADRLDWSPNVGDVLMIDNTHTIAAASHWHSLLAPESPSSPNDAVTRSDAQDLGAGVPYHVTYALVLDPGERAPRTWIEDTGRWFAGADQRPARARGVIRVVPDSGLIGRSGSGCDMLTGAQTRAQLLERAERMFTHAGRAKTSFGLLLIGIDNLASINRTYGFSIADEAISAIAGRIRGVMRITDGLARYSGGKFALLLDSCGADQLAPAAERFIAEIAGQPVETSVGPLVPLLHIGAVCGPRHARNPQMLLQNAEDALMTAREMKIPYRIFDPAQARDEARVRINRTRDIIISALNDRRIEIALEPIVCARTGEPVLFEALMRLRLENGDLVSPGAIIPVAERLGIVEMLDQRVLELALARLGADRSLKLSVNMSGVSFHAPGAVARLAAALIGRADVAARLTVELTETCAIADIEATSRLVRAIKNLGVKVAMDDFGSGHTSFRSLRSLEIDLIKIDGAFVQNLARSPDDRFFVRTLVQLAQHLRIPTVAEWVSDAETARLLGEWGVDYFQGELFGCAEHPTVVDLPLAGGAAA
ncbi:MAG: bifunctional diguanylate cyclase/phosphodiesterase [Beijerinckiaceae bacterium]|nr:bifunctional diguanylate cyclase/phosphodiesterase [Beijerinckiaceae bacterium]